MEFPYAFARVFVLAAIWSMQTRAMACGDLFAGRVEELQTKVDPEEVAVLDHAANLDRELLRARFIGVWGKSFFRPGRQHCSQVLRRESDGRWLLDLHYRSQDAGDLEGGVTLRYDLRELTQVWTLKTNVPAGRSLRCSDDLERQYREMAVKSRSPWKGECDALSGLTARHPLSAGAVLTMADLWVPPIVREGEMVQVKTLVGGVEISSSAIALDNGDKGQLIRLAGVGNKAVFKGIVVDAGRVLSQ